jgi:hypothetical protein
MAETVEKTFSNLVPLLVLMAIVFGVLILAAFLLRYWVRRGASAGVVKRTASLCEMCAGDLGVVLGRTYTVVASYPLEALGGHARYCLLQREEGPTRLLLRVDETQAVYFPGTEAAPEGFPDSVSRDEGAYARKLGPIDLAPDLKLALYAGPGERHLAIEAASGKTALWRGKDIPVEGVSVLKEQGKQPASPPA